MKIKKKRTKRILFIALVVLLVLILAYLYLIAVPRERSKENNTINVTPTEVQSSNQSKQETKNQSKEIKETLNLAKEIRIDCLIGSEDLCYAEGDSRKGWIIGALDKNFVKEFKDKYKISSDIITITSNSIIVGQNKILVKKEDIDNILRRMEEFSLKIREKGREKLNVESAKFEFITLKSKDGRWFWQYAISDIGTNFPDGSERVLLTFNVE